MGLQTLAGATFATALLGAGTVVSANVLTVQQGDTLSEIAQKHHTTVAKLAKDNHIKNVDFITVGQKLNIDDNSNHTVTRKATDTDTHYTVVSGDTLSTIAEAYGTSAQAIAELNNMSVSDTLHIGQLLTVAGTTASAKPVEPVAQSAVPEPASTATSDVQASSAVAEPASTATSTVSEPETVASSAIAEPASPATSDAQALETVASSAVSDPVSTATSDVSTPSSTATSDASELETVASSAVTEPVSTATSDVQASSSSASSAVTEPASTAMSDVQASNSITSSAVAEPESTATSTDSESIPVASSAVVESVSTATSDVQTPTAPEQTVSTPAETPVANTMSGALGAGTLTSAQKNAIVNEALSLSTQNIPYVWGGKTTAGFDCSGLASYVFAQAGLSLPSYTVSEEAYVNTMDVSSVSDVTANAQPGDLLFWGDHGSTWHVAIYIGGGQYVAAPQPGMNVEVENVSPYFMPSFIGRY